MFQTTVNITTALGVPGALFDSGPVRSEPWELNSADAAYNIVGSTAYTVTSEGVVRAGGTGVFAGILANPKVYSTNGTTAGALLPTLTLPNFTEAELVSMGALIVQLPGPAAIGDLITYDTTSGQLNSITPQTQFTASIAPGGASTADVLTVTAVAKGVLAIGSVISGVGIPVGTSIISLGTGKGNTGTYNLSTINLLTVSSEAMTAPNIPPVAFSATATIAGTTMTVSAVASGSLRIGDEVFGTGVAANTVITALGSGVGGTGTYTVNNSQTVTPGVTITGPLNALVPNAVVDRFTVTASGLAVIKLTN